MGDGGPPRPPDKASPAAVDLSVGNRDITDYRLPDSSDSSTAAEMESDSDYTLVQSRHLKRKLRRTSAGSDSTHKSRCDERVFSMGYSPTTEGTNFNSLNRQSLTKYFDRIASGHVRKIRINARKNNLTVDMWILTSRMKAYDLFYRRQCEYTTSTDSAAPGASGLLEALNCRICFVAAVAGAEIDLRVRIDKDPLQPGYELTRENERSLSDRQAADVCYGPALMISSVLVLFCLVSFLSGVVNRRLMAAQRLTCSSNLCLRFADVINRSATARVPPCSDFYAHVCAEWDQGNLESPQELQFRSIVERLYLRLAREPVPTHNQTSFQKAAGFYQSCLAVLLDGKSELREISKALRRVGVRWPQRSEDPDLLVTAAMLKQWFDLDSVLVFSMPDTATLSVGPPSTDWLHDIKRQRYAVDFADNSLGTFACCL
ncbi:hypothetical protein HPB49_026083 [Dermacentor silvarum]|nr:hypothetical protein HPB49_026083 [Dermacentor silvarum]